jgi:hypothetical protein
MHMNIQMVVVIKKATRMDIKTSKLNTNLRRYIVRDYYSKYPTDQGDQNIHEEDKVHPPNHLWADQDECRSWRLDAQSIGQRSDHAFVGLDK